MRVLSILVLLGCASALPAQTDRMTGLLEELSNAFGPPGYEQPVRAIMRRELVPLSDRNETDGMGSFIAVLGKNPDAPHVMLDAHMDELGLMVKYIDDRGYVKIQPLGGWLDQGLINQRFIIHTHKGDVLGVTGLKTPHIMSQEERTRLIPRQKIFLDVGATSRADAEERLGIRPGDPIAPDSRFAVLNGGPLYLGKAWDDRAGLAVMIEVLHRLRQTPPPATIYAAATVQEEIGLRGAHTSSYLVKPDIGISIEAGIAADYPGISPDEAQERLGHGPGIWLHDNSMIPNLKLRDFFVEVAKQKGIPLQFEVLTGAAQDAAEMQRAYAGAPSINVTIPIRYLHNHNGVISRRDIDRTVDLITEVVRRLDRPTIQRLKSFD